MEFDIKNNLLNQSLVASMGQKNLAMDLKKNLNAKSKKEEEEEKESETELKKKKKKQQDTETIKVKSKENEEAAKLGQCKKEEIIRDPLKLLKLF